MISHCNGVPLLIFLVVKLEDVVQNISQNLPHISHLTFLKEVTIVLLLKVYLTYRYVLSLREQFVVCEHMQTQTVSENYM